MTNIPQILFVVPSLSGGGAERIVAKIAQNVSQKGTRLFNVKLIVLLQGLDEFDVKGVDVVRVEGSSIISSLLKLYRLFRTIRPSLVVSTLKHVTFWVSILCKIQKISHISRVANTTSAETSSNRLWHLLAKINYSLDKKVVAVSQGVKYDLISVIGVPEYKIHVISNPVNVPILQYKNYNYGKRNNVKIIFVGRLVPQKNIEFIIKIVSLHKKELFLEIIGSGPLENSLKSLVAERGLIKNVKFFGQVADVDMYYQRAHVLVLSSYFEGMPNVILEALSNGLPVVAYDCQSGPAEILKSKDLGSLIQKFDEDVFYAAILDQVGNDNEFLSAKRRRYVESNFSLEYISDLYVNLIKGCLL
jgi:glycosyltransferase involved in cell wall biosynthesis